MLREFVWFALYYNVLDKGSFIDGQLGSEREAHTD